VTVSTNVRIRFNDVAPLDPVPLIEHCQQLGLDTSSFQNKANSYCTAAGKQPGIGYLLMARSDLDAMPNRHQPLNVLSFEDITDGDIKRTLILNRLRIISEQAIYPSFVADHPEFTGGNDPVLITIADSRSVASTLPINWSYNIPTADDPLIPRNNNPLPDYTHLLLEIWKQKEDAVSSTDFRHTLEEVLGVLNITSPTNSTSSRLIPPYNLRFNGISAYDAFHSAIDATFGLAFYYASTNRTLAILGGSNQSPSSPEKTLYDQYLANRLINHEGRQRPVFVPATVTLHYHNYDYQWWRDPHSRTGLDRYTQSPVGTLHFNTTDLLANATLPYEIIKYTNHTIWSPLPAWTTDQGQISDVADWFAYQRSFAEHHLRGLVDQFKWDSHTFDGLLNLEPTPGLFTAIAWYDYGHGFTTKTFRVPPHHFNTSDLPDLPTPSRPVVENLQSPPDLSRIHIPTPREAEGVLVYPPTLGKDYIGNVQILAGEWVPGLNVNWSAQGTTVEAVNLTGQVKQGDRVQLRFNYQLKTGGGWVIVGNISNPNGSDSGGGGPYLSLMAIGTAYDDFCSDASVPFHSIYYISPQPHTIPWSQSNQLTAINPLAYAGIQGAIGLLWVNPANPSTPYLIAVQNECVTMYDDFRSGGTSSPGEEDEVCQLTAQGYKTSVPTRKPDEKRKVILSGQTISFLTDLSFNSTDCSIWGVSKSVCLLGNKSGTIPGVDRAMINLKNIPEECCPCQPCDCSDWPEGNLSVFLTVCLGDEGSCSDLPTFICERVMPGSARWETQGIDACGIDDEPEGSGNYTGKVWFGTVDISIAPGDEEGLPQTVTYFCRICCTPDGRSVAVGILVDGDETGNTNSMTETSFSCNPFALAGYMDSTIGFPFANGGRDFNCDNTDPQICIRVEGPSGGGSGAGSGSDVVPVPALPATENYQNAVHLSSYHTSDGNAYFGSHPAYDL
jgi:hypothetical protein